MDIRKIKIEHVLFGLAFLLGVYLRFLNLGTAPLSDNEARWALQAFHVAHAGTNVGDFIPGQEPGYIALTGLLFAIIESSNALARFWPALAGSLLVLVPAFFRPPLPRTASLILAFGLAIDPGLVAASRHVASPIAALTYTLIALGFLFRQKPVLCGLFLGLAALSGPAFLTGIVIFTLTGTVYWIASRKHEDGFLQGGWQVPRPTSKDLIKILLSTLATITIVGTVFLWVDQGLAAGAASLAAFFQGWSLTSGVPVSQQLIALLVYQPVPVIFGTLMIISSLYRRRFRGLVLLLTLWTLFAFALVLLYPNRQLFDLMWVIVPLWALAAIELSSLFQRAENPLVSLGQALLIIILSGLLWFNYAGLSRSIPEPVTERARLILMIGIFGLWAITTFLVALGWSWSTARLGLVLGFTISIAVYTTSVLWGVTQIRPNLPQELWYPSPATGQAELVLKTVKDLSNWSIGTPNGIDIAVTADSPALLWLLRDYSKLRVHDSLTMNDLPSIIFTRKDEQAPSLTASYRGQDFDWELSPGWAGALPPNFSIWLAFREAPVQIDPVILWVRSDLFLGTARNQTTSSSP